MRELEALPRRAREFQEVDEGHYGCVTVPGSLRAWLSFTTKSAYVVPVECSRAIKYRSIWSACRGDTLSILVCVLAIKRCLVSANSNSFSLEIN